MYLFDQEQPDWSPMAVIRDLWWRNDPIGYEAIRDKVSVHDFHATMLHLLGFNHEKFTYPFQGVGQRLTNITKPGTKVVKGVLA